MGKVKVPSYEKYVELYFQISNRYDSDIYVQFKNLGPDKVVIWKKGETNGLHFTKAQLNELIKRIKKTASKFNAKKRRK